MSLEEISKATYDRYLIDFKKYFCNLQKKRICSIDECDIEEYVRDCIHEFGMTPKSFSNFRTLIYGIFKYAERKKYISFSITNTIKDMEISPKAFKHAIHYADEQVYMPQEKDEKGNVHYDVKNFPKSEAGLRFAILPQKYEWILDEIENLNQDGKYLFEKMESV